MIEPRRARAPALHDMHIDRKLVAGLAVFGPIMGALIVLGAFPRGWDRVAWLVVSVVCAVTIARRDTGHPFAHGAVVGFINGAVATFIQGVFAGTLAANNAWIPAAFADKPQGFNLRLFILQLAPFIGIAGALVGGFLAWAAARAMGRDASGSDAQESDGGDGGEA